MALGGSGSGGASSRGVRAGAAYVELNGKDNLSGFLAKMKEKLAGAMKAMAVGAVLGIGSALGGLNVFGSTADDIARMNSAIKAMGMSATGGSGPFGVLNQFGDLGENVEGMTQFAQKVQDAFTGVGEEPKKLFEGLSVSAADLMNMPLEEKFLRIHGAIRELPQDMQQFKLSMLGGTDSMKKWLPLLSMSNEELREQARAMAFGSAEMDEATQASRAMKEAGGSLNRVWQQTVIMLAPMVRDAAKGLSEAMKPIVEWSKGRTLGMIGDELAARFNLGWEQVKLGAKETWIDVVATSKLGLVSLGDFVGELFTADFWSGLTASAAAQFAGVGTMFSDTLNGMRGEAIKIGAEIAAALTDPRKLAMLPLLPLAAPVAAGDLLKRADEEFKRQMTALGADFAAGKFGRFDRAGILAEAEAAKLAAGGGVDAARGRLDALLAQIEADRGGRRGDGDEAMPAAMRQQLANVSRAMGTFGGSGDFIARSFGGKGSGIEKRLDMANVLAEQQKKLLEVISKNVGFPRIT